MLNDLINISQKIFNPLINLGPAVLTMLVLTVAAVLVGVKFSKALQGGLTLAIALVGIGAVMGILTNAFNEPLQSFVKNTGIELNTLDVGWAPLGTITWSSPYTLFFLFILVILNVVLILTKKTNTLDVDIFNVWHLAFTALFAMHLGASLIVTILMVLLVGVLKFINADIMRPTFNKLLNAPKDNPMTTTHMSYMMNPFIMIFNKIFDKFFYKLDKYDFDAAKLNNKIGFWGSRFSIGVYLGIFIGILAKMNIVSTLTLGFTAGACLELFANIGQWFIRAVEPLSQGIADFANKKLGGRQLNISIDWPFIAGKSEIWLVANILAPILLVASLILPGNTVLPLAGIICTSLSPGLLVVTGGKVIRMIVIGIFELPIFLYASTIVAPFITETAHNLGAFPAGVDAGTQITFSTMEGPIEKFLAYFVGKASSGQIKDILIALVFVVVYVSLFFWYKREMDKRNIEIEKEYDK